MKLSTKGRYGLRAMVDLARYSEDGTPVSIQSISQREMISESYLEQLVRKLRTAGILVSHRGASGGYILARPADEITVGEVLRALEGNLKAVECVSETAGACTHMDLCVTRFVWERVNNAIEEAVDSITIGQLVRESEKQAPKSGSVEGC